MTKQFELLWKELGDIPINNNDEIEQDFYHFKKGTPKEEIWHYLEDSFNVSIGRYLDGLSYKNFNQ